MYRNIINARTFPEIQAAINDDAQIDYDADSAPILEQLVIGVEGTGGLLTQTEFELARFCTEENLKKSASDRLIRIIKRRAFSIEDLHAGSI